MRFFPPQSLPGVEAIEAFARNVARKGDAALRMHPAVGVSCPNWGPRVGKPCVSTAPTQGVGTVGSPTEGVDTERIAAAREAGGA